MTHQPACDECGHETRASEELHGGKAGQRQRHGGDPLVQRSHPARLAALSDELCAQPADHQPTGNPDTQLCQDEADRGERAPPFLRFDQPDRDDQQRQGQAVVQPRLHVEGLSYTGRDRIGLQHGRCQRGVGRGEYHPHQEGDPQRGSQPPSGEQGAECHRQRQAEDEHPQWPRVALAKTGKVDPRRVGEQDQCEDQLEDRQYPLAQHVQLSDDGEPGDEPEGSGDEWFGQPDAVEMTRQHRDDEDDTRSEEYDSFRAHPVARVVPPLQETPTRW